MTPELLQLATDLDRLFRNTNWTREMLVSEALRVPHVFARKLRHRDREDAAREARFLAHLDDVIADPKRVSSLPEYWSRRGVTAAVAASMIEDRKAGRPVCLPVRAPDPERVMRMAVYIERVRPQIAADLAAERNARRIAELVAAEEAEVEAERVAQAERDALAEPFREADEDVLAQFGDLP